MSTLQIHTWILFQVCIVQVHCKKVLSSDSIQIYYGLTPDIGLSHICKCVLGPLILLIHARVTIILQHRGYRRLCVYVQLW